MAGWIISISASSPENWKLGLDAGVWATKTRRNIRAGDSLFFWQSQAGLIARARATTDAAPADDYAALPWPDRWGDRRPIPENEIYPVAFRMQVLQETLPLALTWSELTDRIGSRAGANTMPLKIDDRASAIINELFRADVATGRLPLEFEPAPAARRRTTPVREEDAIRPPVGTVVTSKAPPRTIDPDTVGASLERHNRTVNAVMDELDARDRRPIRPPAWFRGELPDVVWRDPGVLNLVEVKGITDLNERNQLRLGLGQILRYRYIARQHGEKVQAWLVIDTPPADSLWAGVCASLDVQMWWPGSAALLVDREPPARLTRL